MPASSNDSATAADSSSGARFLEPLLHLDLQQGPLCCDSIASPVASTFPVTGITDFARAFIMDSDDRRYVMQFLNRLSPSQLLFVYNLVKVLYVDLKDRGLAQGSVSGPEYTNRVMRSCSRAGLAPVYSK